MTSAQCDAINAWLGTTCWYEDAGVVYRLLGTIRTDVRVTASGNVRLGTKTLVRRDGTTSPIV